jgi:glycosyltransferase involved in cell wall biosynthesis
MSYTLLITTKNKPELLDKLLSSLKTDYDIEIIAFDIDSENDAVGKVVQLYTGRYNIISPKVFSMGMAACIDMGISMASNSTIIYCQDDITLTPFCLDKLYEIYTQQNAYFLLSPNIKEGSNDLKEREQLLQINLGENYMGRMFACFIISEENYLKSGGIDTNFHPAYFEDMDFFYRANLLKLKAAAVLDIVVNHTPGSTLKALPQYSQNLSRSEQYYINKWGGKPGEEKFTIPFNGKERVQW